MLLLKVCDSRKFITFLDFPISTAFKWHKHYKHDLSVYVSLLIQIANEVLLFFLPSSLFDHYLFPFLHQPGLFFLNHYGVRVWIMTFQTSLLFNIQGERLLLAHKICYFVYTEIICIIPSITPFLSCHICFIFPFVPFAASSTFFFYYHRYIYENSLCYDVKNDPLLPHLWWQRTLAS